MGSTNFLPWCTASPVSCHGLPLAQKVLLHQGHRPSPEPTGKSGYRSGLKGLEALFLRILTVTNKRTSSGHLPDLQVLIVSTRIIPNPDKTYLTYHKQTRKSKTGNSPSWAKQISHFLFICQALRPNLKTIITTDQSPKATF